MWQPRVLCPGVFSALTLALCLTLSTRQASAQCSGVMQQQTYSYTLSGTNTSNYNVSVPQFNNVAGYTLTSVVYQSVATTTATLSLTNTSSSSQFVFPNISRADFVQLGPSAVAFMGSVPYNGFAPVSLNPSPTAGDAYTYPSTQIYTNQALLNTTITNAATLVSTYTGSGNLALSYRPQMFVNSVQVGVTPAITETDNITFSVTYNYCNTLLATNFLSFTATRQGASDVVLNWSVADEKPGRLYYIDVSTNGTDFADAGSQPSQAMGSNASYSYNYTVPGNASGKLYFRIKQVDVNGEISFSTVCVINLDNSSNSAFSIFPNPATTGNFISLNLPGDNRSWQVEIFSADGSLMQRNAFNNASLVTVNFNTSMAAGTYFVRAVNPLSGEKHTGSFLVRK